MERKIGETFEFEGKTLQVKENASSSCDGCFFDEQHILCSKYVVGYCELKFRTDKKDVIFVEVQPQELNLCEILKYCPEGEPFWSPMLGDVKLHNVDHEKKRIYVILKTGIAWYINADATLTTSNVTSEEIMLYPSREQRDWTKVKYEPRKERFDPKTLKPFDKVLVKNDDDITWVAALFSHIIEFYDEVTGNDYLESVTSYCTSSYCIPYNDETKHLVGTTEEAPDFYKYWED